MALKNYQYNAIMRGYDDRQSKNRYEADRRRGIVLKAIPEYTELEKSIVDNSMEYARLALLSGENNASLSIEQLRSKNEQLSRQKHQLLTAHGYPADYLDPIFDCKDCKDTGYIGDTRCHCFEQAVVDLLYKQSNLSQLLAINNFSNFTFDYYDRAEQDPVTGLTSYETMQKACETAIGFVKNFDTSFENLLFYGNAGLGKTFLSHCIAKELLNTAHTVLYLTSYQLFDVLGKAMREENEGIAETEEHILNCDLLIIDDLGTELVTAFTISRLNFCINERYSNKRSTIISTNLSLSDLADFYGERNFSRLSGGYTTVRFFGKDIRLKKKTEGKP